MTSATDRKRAERQRRKEAGEVRVEVWLDAEEYANVKRLALVWDIPVSDVLKSLSVFGAYSK